MDELLLDLDFVLVGNARRESLGGREYLIAEATILKEGVLPGSDGPLFYPLDEINQDVGIWNGYPVTAKHPFVMADGKKKSVSARIPSVANKFQIGTVYNDRMAGAERKVDLYLDIENANRIDSRIVRKVEAGEKVNVSTGLFLKKLKVDNQAHNGKGYTHSVKGIRPDHLAVLVDERGACSTDDGCGINVTNRADYPEYCPYCDSRQEIDPTSGTCNRCGKKVAPLTNWGDPTVNKDQLVTWLVTNCECWKGEGDKEVLNAMDEAKLKALKSTAEKAKVADPLKALVANIATRVGFEDKDPTKLPEFVTNMYEKKAGGKKMPMMDDDEEDEEEKEKAKKKAKVDNKTVAGEITNEAILNAFKALPAADRMNLLAPAGSKERQYIDSAKSIHEREKIAVINKLTAGIKDEEERKAKILKLREKDLPTLNEYLEYAGLNGSTQTTQTEDETYLANFFGNQGGPDPTANKGAKKTNNPLMPRLAEYGDLEETA